MINQLSKHSLPVKHSGSGGSEIQEEIQHQRIIRREATPSGILQDIPHIV